MSSSPRSPAEHYRLAEQALADAQVSVNKIEELLTALVHSVLSTVPPRRAPKRPTVPMPARPTPAQRWLTGDDDQGGDAA
jgi:hypothetical protein